jgi:hypothetical protein
MALALTALWLIAGPQTRASAATGITAPAQTQLEEIEPPRAETAGGTAELTIVVDPLGFSAAWLEVQRSASRHGGTVLSATAETVERDGQLISVGVAELRVPPSGFPDVLGDVLSVGTLVDGLFTGDVTGVVGVDVTVTESVHVTTTSGPEGSMISRALDTAGNVVLTIASVVIVVAAAVVPLALLALAGYAAFRWVRSQMDGEPRSRRAAVVERHEPREDAFVD